MMYEGTSDVEGIKEVAEVVQPKPKKRKKHARRGS